MILTRILLPLLVVCLFTAFIVYNINKDKEEKEDKDKKYVDDPNLDLDKYIKEIKLNLLIAEKKADLGVKSAFTEIEKYKAELDKINKLKQTKITEL